MSGFLCDSSNFNMSAPSSGSEHIWLVMIMFLAETYCSCPCVSGAEAGDKSRTRLVGGDNAGLVHSRSCAGEAGDCRRFDLELELSKYLLLEMEISIK